LRLILHGAGDFFAALAIRIEQGIHFLAQVAIALARLVEERRLLPGWQVHRGKKDRLDPLPAWRRHSQQIIAQRRLRRRQSRILRESEF
jgi:hypothetical protein